MKTTLLVFVFQLLYASISFAEIVGVSTGTYSEVIYRFRELPQVSFSVLSGINGETIVEVGRADKPVSVQILPGVIGDPDSIPNPENYLTIEDINFDGYPDLKFNEICGTAGCSYQYWWFDKKSEQYFTNELLSNVRDPMLDSKEKTLSSVTDLHHFCAGCFESHVYKWTGSNFILIRRISNGVKPDTTEPNEKRTVMDYVAGKYKSNSISPLKKT